MAGTDSAAVRNRVVDTVPVPGAAEDIAAAVAHTGVVDTVPGAVEGIAVAAAHTGVVVAAVDTAVFPY